MRPITIPQPYLILAFAALFLMTSCRAMPVAPREPAAVARTPAPGGDLTPSPWDGDGRSHVPAVTAFRSEVVGDSLYLYGRLRPGGAGPVAPYDPSHPGGWMLQLLMNTDQAPTGYPWQGIDYLVRGGEPLADGSYVVRRVTLDDAYPGGWGPQSGAARVTTAPHSFVVAVPLAAIGDDDGQVDFVLETYATVACPECEGGISHQWAASYAGSTSAGPRGGAVAASAGRVSEAQLLAAARPLSGRPRSSDTDAR